MRSKCAVWLVSAWGANAYLDAKILVDFESPFEQADVLCQVCKLPHVPQSLQCSRFLDGRFCLHLLPTALSCDHLGGACQAATRMEGREFQAGRCLCGGRDAVVWRDACRVEIRRVNVLAWADRVREVDQERDGTKRLIALSRGD